MKSNSTNNHETTGIFAGKRGLPPMEACFYFANEGIKEIMENTLTIANDQFQISKSKICLLITEWFSENLLPLTQELQLFN